jgi:type II secretory pathway pseudopilin PulG
MKNKNSAFTLVEVLVATVIGVISILAAFSSYNYFNKSYKSVSQKSAINSSAREALTAIARDLRNTGYLHIDFTRETHPERRLIELVQKELDGSDKLVVYQGTTPNSWIRIIYRPKRYNSCKFTTEWCKKYGNGMYLASTVIENPTDPGSTRKIIYDDIEFVPNITDFQVVLRDKDGNELYPVCDECGSVEISQGSNTSVGSLNKGQVNMQKVHTAEIYLTIQSAKEVYKKNKAIRIINHEGGTYGNTKNFDDKYHRETFFISVHTRNLATPKVIAEKTGESIGTGTSYN